MSKSRKAEKRLARKEKKRLELEKKLTEEKIKYDILSLLKNEQLDTKPNMAKFFKSYIEMIHCHNNGKIKFYPNFKYKLSKVFVRFLDGHELIYDMLTDGKFTPKYYLYYRLDEEELKENDIKSIEEFFLNLIKFKFIY